jgi:hypothetical protein
MKFLIRLTTSAFLATTSLAASMLLPAAPVSAQSATLNGALEEASWGDTSAEVIGYYRERERQAYLARIEGLNDPLEIDRLRREADAAVSRVSSSLEAFDSTQTGYEVSVIRGEIVGGQGQSMVSVRPESGSRFYIFTNDSLRKFVEVYDIAALGYIGFEAFVERLGQVLGRPESSDFEQDDLGIRRLVRASWSDGQTRLRVEDRSRMFSAYLLVYTDTSVQELTVDPAAVAQAISPAGRTSVGDLLRRASAESEDRTVANRNVVDDIIGQRTVITVGAGPNETSSDALAVNDGPSALDDDEEFADAPRLVRERRSAPTRSTQQPAEQQSTGTDIY